MFDQLVESRPVRSRSTAQMVVSIAAHTVVIALSIQLTRAVAATIVNQPIATEMRIFRAPDHVMPRTLAAGSSAASPTTLVAVPAPPLSVPMNIPPIQIGKTFDVHQFDTKGLSRNLVAGTPTDLGGVDTGFVATLAQVDDPTVMLSGPLPVYPPALKEVGIEGSVQLRYVVGIDSLADKNSLVVVRSTNRAFEGPALDAIKQAKFRPARIKGKAVQQLVEQVVRFTLSRGRE